MVVDKSFNTFLFTEMESQRRKFLYSGVEEPQIYREVKADKDGIDERTNQYLRSTLPGGGGNNVDIGGGEGRAIHCNIG